MTVKLLGPWGSQPSGTLYTTDAATEAAMVAAKVATNDLTGAVVNVPAGGVTQSSDTESSGPALNMPAPDVLPAVGVMTSLVPSPTPANEYPTLVGSYSGTDGDIAWGAHQSVMVRMADLTCFAIVHEVSNLLLKRSATGGAYGSAWTTVATITNASRAIVDLDAHLLRNPLTNQVHLIATDSTNRVRVRTYDTAGTLVSDVLVPDIYPGYNAAFNWLRDGGTAGTAYSSASIGADGTIAIVRAVTSTPPANYVPNMVSGLQVQTLRWDGATWKYSGQRLFDVGPRMSYSRVWVSPPGNRGFIVGLGFVDVQFKEWTQAKNPNYNSSWTNTIGNSSYFGGGRGPELRMFKIPLTTLDSINLTTVLGPNYRTTDITSTSPASSEYGGYAVSAASMDSTGRIWIGYSCAEDFTTIARAVAVIRPDGTRQHKLLNPGVNTAGQLVFFHEDMTGAMWMGWQANGAAMSSKIIPFSEPGGVLTAPNLSGATELGTGAWGTNLTSAQYEAFAGLPRNCDERNGSVRTHNWVEFIHHTAVDHVGATPGTPTTGNIKAKRVRIQLPI
jgi:hypothetical protein